MEVSFRSNHRALRLRWVIADMSGTPIIDTSGLVRISMADGSQMANRHSQRLAEDVRSRVNLCRMLVLQRYEIC